MRVLRLALSAIAIVLLFVGFIASQYAAMTGQALEYARLADQAPIRYMALILLLSAIVLALIRDRDGEAPES